MERSPDVHKLSHELLEPYQTSKMRDIDTVDDCLTVVHPDQGQMLAQEFWQMYKNGNALRRVLHRVLCPGKVRSEARAQGPQRQHRATVNMLLRTIGLHGHEKIGDEHLVMLEDFLSMMGLEDSPERVQTIAKGLRESRQQYHQILYVTEALKRKPVMKS